MLNGPAADVTIYFGLTDGSTNETAWEDSVTLPAREFGGFFADVNGLVPGTNYYFRCRIENAYGQAWASSSSAFSTPPPVEVTLVRNGSKWRFFDQTNDLGTAWRNTTFDDSTWKIGAARLGFGGDGEVTKVTSNRQWTTYFRRAFYVPDPDQVLSLTAQISRDDGAVLYLNGSEVWRDTNMPSGLITNQTPARSALAGTFETNWIAVPLQLSTAELLVPGWNWLAAEVHQSALTSSDLGFDLKLDAALVAATTPSLRVDSSATPLTLSWPAEGSYFALYVATNLNPPVMWTPISEQPVFTNNQWSISLPPLTNAQRFFRLQTQ